MENLLRASKGMNAASMFLLYNKSSMVQDVSILVLEEIKMYIIEILIKTYICKKWGMHLQCLDVFIIVAIPWCWAVGCIWMHGFEWTRACL